VENDVGGRPEAVQPEKVWTVGSSKRRPTSCDVLSDSMEQMSTHCIQIFVKFLHTFRSRRVVSRGVEQVGSGVSSLHIFH
jgi:hypothetical protein